MKIRDSQRSSSFLRSDRVQQPDPDKHFVRLFGAPAMLREGHVLQLSPTQTCLLALVYGSGPKGVSRSEAAWLLWEADDAPAARHRLSQLLYSIRRRVGIDCLEEGTSDRICGVLNSDVSDFVRALQGRQLIALKNLAEKEFLSELQAPTPPFAHWVDGRRASFRRSLRDLASAELGAAESVGDWTNVAHAAELLLEVEPADEAVLRRLLQARALSGSRVELAAALRSYGDRHLLVCSGERWNPEPETLRLVERIEQNERISQRSATPVPPLMGRAEPLRQLYGALASRAQAVEFTVVAGEAGIGKTRLIREALTRLRLEGCTVLESGSSQLQRDLPLHSLLGALTDRRVIDSLGQLEEPWKSSLAVLLPQLAGGALVAPPVLDPQATSRRLMEALYQLLRLVGGNGPIVLFLDDLQWLDKTTLCTMEFLRDRTPPLALSVAFGLRTDAELDQSLRSFVDAARANGEWIELDELDQPSADALLAAASPRELTADELARLGRAAGRSPFFLIELVNDYCRRSPGRSTYDPLQHIPSSIRQLISNRLDALSREGRTLLQLLSVAGSMSVDAPITIEELPTAHLPDIADDLLRARLIQHDAGTISIRHDLIRQTAYELMGPIKKAVLHRKAAQALIDRTGESAYGAAAIHFDRAGDREMAFKYAINAAATAQASGAVPEAIFFWQTAQRNASTSDDARLATQRLAELLYEARRLADAVPQLEAAAAHSDKDENLRFGLFRLDALSELPGADQEGYLREVERIARTAAAESDWTLHAEAVEVRLRMLDRLNRVDAIRVQILEIRSLAANNTVLSPYARCLIHSILALSSFYHDDDEGVADATEALSLAQQHDISRLLLRAYNRKIFCYGLRGRLHTPDGIVLTQAALEWAARSGDLRSRATIYNTVGCYYLDTHDLTAAERFFREAEKLVSGPSERALVYGNLGELSHMRGDVAAAEAYYRLAGAEADRQPVSGFISVVALAGLGLCALESGSMAAAQRAEPHVRQALEGPWIHDPYLIIRFLAELYRRRGRVSDAVKLIHERAKEEERRPIYWIRTKVLEAKYLRLVDPGAANELCSTLRQVTERLGLSRMLDT